MARPSLLRWPDAMYAVLIVLIPRENAVFTVVILKKQELNGF
jgi:hypothetical protein